MPTYLDNLICPPFLPSPVRSMVMMISRSALAAMGVVWSLATALDGATLMSGAPAALNGPAT
jgi:hypothetical protein